MINLSLHYFLAQKIPFYLTSISHEVWVKAPAGVTLTFTLSKQVCFGSNQFLFKLFGAFLSSTIKLVFEQSWDSEILAIAVRKVINHIHIH